MFLSGRLENEDEKKKTLKLKKVDYSARSYKHKYIGEQSYTKLDHQFLRQYLAPHIHNEDREMRTLRVLRRMALPHLKRMLFNIFPCDDFVFRAGEANTLLHYLAVHQLGYESLDFIAAMTKKDNIIVPFLKNTVDMTPLHITVEAGDNKLTNSLIRLLKRTPMDNHSRLISDLWPKIIGEMDIPKINKYFDKRMYQISVCKTTKSLKLALPGNDYDMKSVATGLQVAENIA
jgi:hypothetical protein